MASNVVGTVQATMCRTENFAGVCSYAIYAMCEV